MNFHPSGLELTELQLRPGADGIGAALQHNIMVQVGGIIASNVYREDYAPLYKQRNRDLICVSCMNFSLYVLRNRSRSRRREVMSMVEKLNYLEIKSNEGIERMDFRFAH